jgi:hypothetical protein
MKLALALFFGLSAGNSAWTTAHDARSGLTIHYPKDWRRDTAPQNFTIVNFTEKDTPRQLLVPMNKASIMLAAPPVQSFDEFNQYFGFKPEGGYQFQRTTIALKTGPVESEQVTLDDRHPILNGHTLVNVFSVHGHLYEIYMLYRGDLKRDEYKALYARIARELEFPR